jgi:hypothetical protein
LVLKDTGGIREIAEKTAEKIGEKRVRRWVRR